MIQSVMIQLYELDARLFVKYNQFPSIYIPLRLPVRSGGLHFLINHKLPTSADGQGGIFVENKLFSKP